MHPASQPAATQPATEPTPASLLTPAQIQIIRVWETNPAQRPRVHVPRRVLDEVLAKYAYNPSVPKGRRLQREVRAWPGWRQLELLFALRAREYYGQVEVLDEPQALLSFRRTIQPEYLMRSCAAANCHARGAGGFTLHRAAPTSDQTLYSNFYILSETTTQVGRLVNRPRPEESLLLQYGLPRREAQDAHPPVAGWQPALQGERDPMYATLVEWIGKQLYQPTPDYELTATSQPAPRQAATTTPTATAPIRRP